MIEPRTLTPDDTDLVVEALAIAARAQDRRAMHLAPGNHHAVLRDRMRALRLTLIRARAVQMTLVRSHAEASEAAAVAAAGAKP